MNDATLNPVGIIITGGVLSFMEKILVSLFISP